jgi:NTE family protein
MPTKNTKTPRRSAQAAALNFPAANSGQVVLVLQGGGALGAYQAGVYQAMHEAGVEPDWVIGTSIGAINAALIVGNQPQDRLRRLQEFWNIVQQETPSLPWLDASLSATLGNLSIMARGIPGFFTPSPWAWMGGAAQVGPGAAAYYQTHALKSTLGELVNLEKLANGTARLTVGAVNIATGNMRYFDSKNESITLDHILASGALPPAFPATEIDGQWYWDGGIYSNTPIEAVLNDTPRQNSLIFAATVWQQTGEVPSSIDQSLGRLKDVQYASRDHHHIAKEQQIHRLRHVIRELTQRLPAAQQLDPAISQLASWGCGSIMHVVQLRAPALTGENQNKDIDFSELGIQARWKAGYQDTLAMLVRAPWAEPANAMNGVIVHAASTECVDPKPSN